MHTDSWTGEAIEGKAVILNTTEGPELIDHRALHVRADVNELGAAVQGLADRTADQLAALQARIEELEEQLRSVDVVPTEPAPAESVAAASVPTQRKGSAK
jgi:transcription elongation GreA/GreB family factor